ncbi:MAG TPA: hypothetical protein VFT13_03705 [Candidatus Krumholzibacteria bacterium]|nr:hypothetical protein [Candidatus Krumholzibacteria bacterium]
MLKFAILVATTAVIASGVGDTAATIVLFGAAAVAVAGFWWKFAVPFAQLTLSLKTLPRDLEEAKKDRAEDREKLVAIDRKATEATGIARAVKDQQDEIKVQVGELVVHAEAVELKVADVSRQAGRIEKGAEIAAERAQSAISIAEAVRRQLERGR